MKHASLRIRLQDAVVLSERDATGGGHRTLRHVPGSVLLGVAAAKLYRRLTPEDAFLAFHSGRLRFLSGYPTADGRLTAWPVPISFHRPKLGKEATIQNACFRLPEDGRQRVALRDGFIDMGGRHIHPNTLMVTKTAIDGSTGSAAEGQLFSYECLAPGQVFLGGLEADDEVPDSLFDAVLEVLSGPVRLGRSRSAEFGRVMIERVDAPSALPSLNGPSAEGAVWLLSDLAVLDGFGQPTVQPTAADLALPGAIDWTRSFVRTRRYSPWNSHRGGYDPERLVLQAGSVLWISGAEAGLPSGQRSVGRHTEAGLGRIWIAPPLLASSEFRLAAEEPTVSCSSQVSEPTTSLLAWFNDRGAQASSMRDLDLRVAALVSDIASLYGLVERELAPAPGVAVGPSSSQWRDVARLAESADDDQVLLVTLFHDRTGVARGDRPGWADPLWDAAVGKRLSMSQSVKAMLETEARKGPGLATVLALLARRLSKHAVVGVRTENRRSSESALQEVRR